MGHRLFRVHFGILAVFSALLWGATVQAAEYKDEFDRDFPLKTTGSLRITNPSGSTSVQGWSMDKLRVKVRRSVEAATPEEGDRALKSYDLDFSERDGNIELSVQSGKGEDLGARLKERKDFHVRVDLIIKAPAHLALEYWGVDGDFTVKTWDAGISARSFKGSMSFEDVSASGKTLAADCPGCRFDFKSIKSDLRCVGGAEPLRIDGLTGKEIYVETATGNQDVSAVSGQQTYISSEGKITGNGQKGEVEFGTRGGAVILDRLEGRASGRTVSGEIMVSASRWDTDERAFLESESGSIQVELPEDFSGTADLWSLENTVQIDFPFHPFEKHPKVVEAVSKGTRFRGVLGDTIRAQHLGLDLKSERDLRISSDKGLVRIARRSELQEKPRFNERPQSK